MAEFNYTNIDAIRDRAESIFKRRFLAAVKQIRDSVVLDQLEALLAQRRFDDALQQAELAATQISNAWVAAYLLAADDVMAFISGSVGITIEFDQVNFRAVEQMRNASLRLVREFTSAQRRSIRAALVEGVRQGLNPREQARTFVQSIGLTANQTQAVANYRRLLEQGSARALTRELRDRRFDGTVQRAVDGRTVLTTEQIDRMVERYYHRSLAHRAETIARTEALGAVHQGSDQAFREAVERGVIDDELTQTWVTAADARVRHPSHTFMNGQTRPMGEAFLSGTGNLLRYPGDQSAPASDTIRCRCVKTTRFTADVVEPAS